MELLLKRLHEIQNKHGYLPEEEVLALSNEYDMPKAKLYGVISFYSRFYTQQTGKYMVRVCRSISCLSNDCEILFDSVSDNLGIKLNETTNDKLFTLEGVECLGHCDKGPVMTINDKVYGDMTKEKAIEIIKSYKEGSELSSDKYLYTSKMRKGEKALRAHSTGSDA